MTARTRLGIGPVSGSKQFDSRRLAMLKCLQCGKQSPELSSSNEYWDHKCVCGATTLIPDTGTDPITRLAELNADILKLKSSHKSVKAIYNAMAPCSARADVRLAHSLLLHAIEHLQAERDAFRLEEEWGDEQCASYRAHYLQRLGFTEVDLLEACRSVDMHRHLDHCKDPVDVGRRAK